MTPVNGAHRPEGAVTIVAVPKPFRNHIGVIQTNAIRSWLRLEPRPQIILVGSEHGVADVAAELGLDHAPSVELNEWGTPLLDSALDQARALATQPWFAYVNCDMILMSDFPRAVVAVRSALPLALIVGRRWDLAVDEPLSFEQDWEVKLRARARADGRLGQSGSMDYLVFHRDAYPDFPPFAIGRAAWDNWFIYSACSRHVPVVDVTNVVIAVHQNHDYRHHPAGERGVFDGVEARRNWELAGGYRCLFTMRDAHYRLTTQGLVRRGLGPYTVYRTLVDLGFGPLLRPLAKLRRSLGRSVR